ncbi:hypothetical protein D9M70_603110 [compost metagenome]
MLVQQVLHEGAALAQGDQHAHGKQAAPRILPAAAEHLHGQHPIFDTSLRHQAQQAALAAIVAVDSAGDHRNRRGHPLIDQVTLALFIGLAVVPVHARF